MSTETDERQWASLGKIRDELHAHAVECAELRGQTNARLDAIERAVSKMGDRVFALTVAVVGAVLSGIGLAIWQATGP